MAEIPRFSKNCSNCAFLLKLTYNYCPQCDTEILEDIEDANYNERSAITEYFNKGYEYSTIVRRSVAQIVNPNIEKSSP